MLTIVIIVVALLIVALVIKYYNYRNRFSDKIFSFSLTAQPHNCLEEKFFSLVERELIRKLRLSGASVYEKLTCKLPPGQYISIGVVLNLIEGYEVTSVKWQIFFYDLSHGSDKYIFSDLITVNYIEDWSKTVAKKIFKDIWQIWRQNQI